MSKGFTLVELLVVVGIISVLIAFLMPALMKARANAIRLQCMSNLRQQGLAVFAYMADNKGNPPHGPDAYTWGGGPNSTGVYVQQDILIDRYTGGNARVWVCPDWPMPNLPAYWSIAMQIPAGGYANRMPLPYNSTPPDPTGRWCNQEPWDSSWVKDRLDAAPLLNSPFGPMSACYFKKLTNIKGRWVLRSEWYGSWSTAGFYWAQADLLRHSRPDGFPTGGSALLTDGSVVWSSTLVARPTGRTTPPFTNAESILSTVVRPVTANGL